tara:strand:- start:265 stop:864 length:600 start_codon:yes stop_codon:yes gene_type:complete
MYSLKIKKFVIYDIILNFDNKISPELQIHNSVKKKIKDLSEVNRFISFNFPNGIQSVVLHFNELTNKELSKSVNTGFKELRISEKVSKLILNRLKILKIYKKGLSNLNLYLLQSGMVFFSKKLLYKVADNIWILSGDKSLDFNYYSKRFILMNVYLFSYNYWLKDQSNNLGDTKNFIEKQISNVLKFGTLKKKIKNFFS